ncbi:diguanylate cyclase [uncultured Devosia sp.]|uniref:diguanylate cyclase n=1 Tax=uncultured Devosia sp. TaxID=211434 RepID=UPI0035CC45A1
MANMAVVTVVVAAWTYAQAVVDRWPPVARSAILGMLFGLGAIATMLSTFSPMDGVFFDLRTTLISTAGLFGGPIGGGLAGVMALLFRASMGGAGVWVGYTGITLAILWGVALYTVVRRRRLRGSDIMAMALLVGGSGIVLAALLPAQLRSVAVEHFAVPSAIVHFVCSLVAGLALLHEQRRRATMRENQAYRDIMESLPDSLNVKDAEGRFIAANPATAALMQAQSAADLIGKTDADFYAPPVASRFRQDELEIIAGGVQVRTEQKLPNLDGNPKWLSTLKVPLFDDQGAPAGIITHNRDVTERHTLMVALEESQRQLTYAMAQMADGVAMFDSDGRLVFCNEQYRASFPLTKDVRVPGMSIREMLEAAAARGEQLNIPRENVEGWIGGIVADMKIASEEEVHLFDGRWLHVRTNPSGDGACMVVVSDITKIKQAETSLLELTEQLQHQVVTDGLTGLLNRRAFDEALDIELARSSRENGWISLLLMDIDRFKAFNDHYGHQAGDVCLQAVSAQFKHILKRPGDVVARYGGEEFVAILPETDEDGAFFIADAFLKAVRALALPHGASEKGIVTASVGLACYGPGEHPRSAAVLVRRADQAMYDAKLAGRDRLTGWQRRRGLGAA